jgi:hypothetical protein
MIQPCNPGNRVPIISFHSKVDPVVRYKGGNGPEDVPFLKDVFFPSQDSNLIVWQKLNGCTKSDTIVNGGSSGYSFIRLSQCSCDVEVHHYATADGGHSWPGGVPNNVSPPSAQIDATDLLWEFVKRYTLGCAVSNVEQEIPMQVLQVYPNPAQSVLTVSGASFNSTYTVVDLFGRAIDRGLITGTIDVSSMKQGVYMITVTQGNKLQTVTFVRD